MTSRKVGPGTAVFAPRILLARTTNPQGDSRRLVPKAIFGDFLSQEKVTRPAGRNRKHHQTQ